MVTLSRPANAVAANIRLLYQPTSWEYIQFLYQANKQESSFLGQEGKNMLDAWLAEEMAEPFVMASATWGNAEPACDLDAPTLDSAVAGQGQVTLGWSGPSEGDITAYNLYYDQSEKTQLVASFDCTVENCTTYTDTGLTNDNEVCYVVTAVTATTADECESGSSNMLCATPQPPGQTQYASVSILETGHWVREGKGKNATETFVVTDTFAPGDRVVVRLATTGGDGQPLSGAVSSLTVSGPENASLTSGNSDGNGLSEANWSTQAPNKKGNGGTTPGDYTITVTGMNVTGQEWDGVGDSVTIHLGSGAAGGSGMDCMHGCKQ